MNWLTINAGCLGNVRIQTQIFFLSFYKNHTSCAIHTEISPRLPSKLLFCRHREVDKKTQQAQQILL
jgi:hypothetical protein